jgi:group I intron endonuclease
MFGIIYKVTNEVNGKIYIGQTIQKLSGRRSHHLSAARNGVKTAFCNALRKYGSSVFKWSIIERCYSADELNEMEFHYIKQYKILGFILYNMAEGGDSHSGFSHTEAAKTKMRLAHHDRKPISESTRRKMSKAHKGFRHTEEAKLNMSLAHNNRKYKPLSEKHKLNLSKAFSGKKNPFYGKSHSKDTKEKMRDNHADFSGINHPQYGMVGKLSANSKEYVVTFPNNTEYKILGLNYFCNKLGLDTASMVHCVSGRQKTHKGFKCRKYNSDLDKKLSIWEDNIDGC